MYSTLSRYIHLYTKGFPVTSALYCLSPSTINITIFALLRTIYGLRNANKMWKDEYNKTDYVACACHTGIAHYEYDKGMIGIFICKYLKLSSWLYNITCRICSMSHNVIYAFGLTNLCWWNKYKKKKHFWKLCWQ